MAKSAGSENTTPVDRPLKSQQEREALRINAVAQSLENNTSGVTSSGTSAIWLKADNQDFLGIYTPAAKAKTLGTVLILHAEGEHPLWPGAIVNLQNYLPEKGWATFSIALPDQTYPDPPPLPTKEELAEHTSTATKGAAKATVENNSTAKDANNNQPEKKYNPHSGQLDIESQAQNRIIAAIRHINDSEKNGIVLYGQGLGGLRAGAYLTTLNQSGANSVEALKALIIIDSPNEISLIGKDGTQAETKKIYDSFTRQDFPILDIVTSSSSENTQQVKRRENEAKIKGLKKYRQHPVTSSDGKTFLTSIYGFLKQSIE